MTLDLAVIALLAVASLAGAASGAVRQVVQLGAVVLAWIVTREHGASVAAGLGKSIGALLGHALGPLLLFLGALAAASLVGELVLRAFGVWRAVRTPADRAVGAFLGCAKGALVAWVLLSALALAGPSAPASLRRAARKSDLAALASRHNLLVRLDPGSARALERALEAARREQRAGTLRRDPDGARLLDDPRVRALHGDGAGLDEDGAAWLMEDPEIRALVERLSARRSRGESGRGRR